MQTFNVIWGWLILESGFHLDPGHPRIRCLLIDATISITTCIFNTVCNKHTKAESAISIHFNVKSFCRAYQQSVLFNLNFKWFGGSCASQTTASAERLYIPVLGKVTEHLSTPNPFIVYQLIWSACWQEHVLCDSISWILNSESCLPTVWLFLRWNIIQLTIHIL